jgi:uncharacterized protein
MGSVTGLLHKHRIIALDTCLWIYHFEQHSELAKPVAQILTSVARGHCKGIVSELVLLELLTGPLKLGRQDIADEYETLITHYPNLALVPITRNILLEAARLRALHGCRTPDAIILATAKEHGATLVVTNDQSWSRYTDLTILCLSEIA